MDKRWRNVLDDGLRDLAHEEPDAFQLERSLAQIKTTPIRRSIAMKTTRTTALGIGVVAVLFAALLLIPATYTVTVGHVFTVQLPDADMTSLRPLHEALADIPDVDNVSLMKSPEGSILKIGTSATRTGELTDALGTAIAGIFPNVGRDAIEVEPVKVERGGNALAALTGGTISINTEGMSDAEIEQAIASALMGAGASDVQVDVNTSPDGTQRTVDIEMMADVEPGEEPGEFTIELQDDVPEGADVQKQRQIEWVTEDE